MTPRVESCLALLAATVLVAACGGGEPGAQPDARQVERRQALAAPASPITPAQLFGWAEGQFADLFPKGPANERITAGGVTYIARHYAKTGNYLGVGEADGVVYGLGAFTANQIQSFGPMASWGCAVSAAHCPPAGKNRYTTTLDGDTREYVVHVPKGYNGIDALPVVFMLHGSGGNGEKFYNISGWVDTGEAHHVITVFPSAWVYDCVYDDGGNKRGIAKWTSYDLELCAGTTDHFRDDSRFIGQMMDELQAKFRVDARRIYLVGFSNGGEMAARAAVELGDRLAAVVANAGGLDAVHVARRAQMPVTVQVGNADPNMMGALGATQPLPMDIGLLLGTYSRAKTFVDNFRTTFEAAATYVTSGDASAQTATWAGNSGRSDHLLRFTLVKDLQHEYPNGTNHPMKGAEVHWAWMSNYTLP